MLNITMLNDVLSHILHFGSSQIFPSCKKPLKLFLSFYLVIFSSALAKQGFYPQEDGLEWHYSNGETQVMTGPYNFEGIAVMVLTHYLNEAIVSEEYLVYDPTGVYSLGTAVEGGELQRYNPPLVIYDGSLLSVGQAWQSETDVAGINISLHSEVLQVQGIETEAGRFNALLIRQKTFTDTGGQTVLDLYYVPSVGIVRFASMDGNVVDLVKKNF
ncbi:MAG: hypothetical protein R2880_05470 [Deinococcales bacterium]